MSFTVPCPECGGWINILGAVEDIEARRFMGLVKEMPPTLVKPWFAYLRLFKPEKQVLRWSRMYKLTAELMDSIQSARIERNNQVHVVPLELWIEALTELVESPPKTLRLPLKGHGYLLEMLASRAEKAAAKTEQSREEERRSRPRETGPRTEQNFQSMKDALSGALAEVTREK